MNALLPNLLKLLLEHCYDGPPLQLVRRRQAPVLRRPRLGQERHGLKHFDAAESPLLRLVLHIRHDSHHQLGGILHLVEIALDTVGRRPLHGRHLIDLHEGNGTIHIAIAIAADPSQCRVHKLGISVRHLHVLHSNVLSPFELDEILLPIDDAEGSVRHELSDVPRMKETGILLEFLLGLIGHHVISRGEGMTAAQYLSAAVDGISGDVAGVGGKVGKSALVHDLGARFELDLDGGDGLAGDSSAKVEGVLDGQARAGLGQAVSLVQRTSEASPHERLHLLVQRPAAAQRQPQLPSHHLGKFLEHQRLEQRSIVPVIDRKRPRLKGRLYEESGHRTGFGHLGLDALLDNVPNLGHARHQRGRVLLEGSDGVGSRLGQRLGVGVADGASHGEEDEFGHELENVSEGEVSEVDVVSLADSEHLFSRGDGRNDGRVLDDDALGLAGRAGGVHNDGGHIGLGGCGGELGNVSGGDEIFERDDLDAVGRRGQIDLGVGCDEVGGVDNGLEGLHVLHPSDQLAHIDLVAHNGADGYLVNGIHHRVHPQGGIHRHDNGRLGERPLRGKHPLGARILKNGDGARGGNLIQGRLFGGGDHSTGAEGRAELVSVPSHLGVRLPPNAPEMLHIGRMLTEKFSRTHAVHVGVPLDGALGDVVEGFDALAGFGGEFPLVLRMDAVERFGIDGDGPDGFAGQELLEGLDPSEGEGHEHEVQGQKQELQGEE
mmetsp:Transcript_30383/g.90622  ORF Transcript_30383/g.90622 Transcript_30383/m.90622 type:complete len:717 (-) Transcript_30383:223-2373(-)